MRADLTVCALLLTFGCGQRVSVRLRPAVPQVTTRGDLGIVFKTEDEAAVAGCNYIWNNEPKAARYEFCGVIYKDAEGIKAGLPETSKLEGYCKGPLAPPGTQAEAGYHNHHDSGDFSRQDRQLAGELIRYLCTPSRLVKKMTSKGAVIVP